jgi:beta-galactosidase
MLINKKTRISFILLILCLNAQAQQSIRLIDGWQFVKKDLANVWETVRPIIKDDHPENYPVWTSIQLPHCVNADDAVDPNKIYYQGGAWYRNSLNISNPYEQGRTLLHFEGAGQKTDVYVYTTKVASHVGGYDEWTVDITDAIASFKQKDVFQKQFKGKIPISIRCDNSRDAEMIPSNLSDFNIYGGIYRYLSLVYVPSLSIDKIFASTSVDKEGKNGELSIKARLYNPLNIASTFVSIELISPEGETIQVFEKQLDNLGSSDIQLTNFSIKQPTLWHPDKPMLYTVEVNISSGNNLVKQQTKVGFRNFEFISKGPFMLNGERLLLRGTQRHEDHAGVGAAMTEAMIRQEMIMIKELGANFIRLGHFQQSRIVLDLCDSLGLLVWEEIPWCRGGLGGQVYQQQAKRMLTNMVEQHFNHPSIILWGMGNENDWPNEFPVYSKDSVRMFMKQLVDLSHQLDNSRKTVIRRCDFCSDIVDVYSPSLWRGWYKGFYTEYQQGTKEEVDKVNHFLHAEWGGDSHAGRHSEKITSLLSDASLTKDTAYFGNAARISKNADWSETYICDLMDWTLKEQENMPWLTGAAQWIFKDFATPIRPENPLPFINQKGLVQRDFTKKENYFVFQSYWSNKLMAHIYGHSWPVRWGKEGEEKLIKVYSNAEQAELFVNGKSYGSKKRNINDFPAAGLRWNVQFNKGTNTVKVVAQKGKKKVEDIVDVNYQTEQWSKPAKLILEKIGEENGIATMQVKLLDDKNVLCLDAMNRIRFGITGDGKLMDNQGTASGSSVLQLSNGAAIIKINTNKGKSVVSVQGEGLPTAFLNL